MVGNFDVAPKVSFCVMGFFSDVTDSGDRHNEKPARQRLFKKVSFLTLGSKFCGNILDAVIFAHWDLTAHDAVYEVNPLNF